MTAGCESLRSRLRDMNDELGAAVTLVVARSSLRWRVVAASTDIGLEGDPIRLETDAEAPTEPVAASGPAATLCRLLGRAPSRIWWAPLSLGRRLVIYWMDAPAIGPATLKAAAGTTERHLPTAQAEDRDAREILLNLIDALTMGLIYHDDDGHRVIANQAGRQILGLACGILTPRSAASALARFAGGTVARDVESAFDVERDDKIYQVRSELIHGAFGSGVLWRIEDVTADRRRRALLAEAKRVAMMAEVAGGVGHEFNNLLARLICQAESIQDATSRQEASDLAEQIIGTAEAGASVVKRLMTYAGGTVIDCRTIDLAALLDGWRQSAEGALAIDDDGCGGMVIADRDLLRASLDELHSNAVQASASRLRLRCRQKNADTLVLEVSDDGHGMTAADCARATDPFFTLSAVGEGTGLGLSMVKGAMRQCGGDAVITSIPGEGTRVTLSLRVAPEESPA